MCGETMRLRARQVTARVPGTSEVKTTNFQEWVCPECDFFEETEETAG